MPPKFDQKLESLESNIGDVSLKIETLSTPPIFTQTKKKKHYALQNVTVHTVVFLYQTKKECSKTR
jgi:hypothetical protein